MSKLKEEVLCNVCGSDQRDLISQKGQFSIPISVVICKNCGLTYLSPRWTKEYYQQFYLNEYDKYYRSDQNVASDSTVSQALVKRMKDHVEHPNSIKRILDVGSGDGTNLEVVGNLFPEANYFAIEPSLKSQQLLSAKNITLINSSVESNWENDYSDYFDLIIMRHVLEHFLDPQLILSKLYKTLSRSGLLYLAVPNSLKPSMNKPLETKWFRMVHTYYFNKYSLWNLLVKSDLWPYKIIEGDEFHQGEVFLFSKKKSGDNKVNLSSEHYRLQKEVFAKRLRQEKKSRAGILLGRIKNISTKIIRNK